MSILSTLSKFGAALALTTSLIALPAAAQPISGHSKASVHKANFKGGKFRGLRRTVDLVALPGKTPDKLVLDTSGLDLGDSIRLEDLDLPEGVKPAAEDNHAVAILIAPKAGQLESAKK